MKHETVHVPVLQKEILEIFNPQPSDNFIDATIDGGGHTSVILEKIGSRGKILGIDLDCELIKALEIKMQKLKIKNLSLICDNYINMKEIIQKNNFKNIKGVLFDLGMSSWHLEKSGRGFSFQKNEPLDMRYQFPEVRPPKILTAFEVINNFRENELADIFWKFGEERFSKRIAKKITEERKKKPIQTTLELVEVIKKSVPRFYQYRRIHFATRVFQALRIAVNQELENLELTLPQALEVLEPAGILIVISFHSLEDRVVKVFFRQKSKEKKAVILTKKPIRPSLEEIRSNFRSRSAKLRAIKKL